MVIKVALIGIATKGPTLFPFFKRKDKTNPIYAPLMGRNSSIQHNIYEIFANAISDSVLVLKSKFVMRPAPAHAPFHLL
jgi:hypothetical protein